MDQATTASAAMSKPGQEQKMSIREIALDLTVFTLSNVNDAISFKPQLCFEVPKQDYQMLKDNYISFTGTSIRKNRSRLFFLPTNVSDELQRLNPSIPEDAKRVPSDGRIYYKNRLITELDYENVKRVEIACAFIAYTALNSFAHFETELPHSRMREAGFSNSEAEADDSDDEMSAGESVSRALKKGNILGFRELGHLVGITPWHFHRVFKVITGLTIREYGQLCVEFIKKNKEIVNTCRVKVEQLKDVQRFSCLDDPSFLQDGSLQYAATENVVLLHEYFIDPNKSKEFKTKKNGSGGSKGGGQQQLAKKESAAHDEGGASPLTHRSEIRKRRSSVMYGRMQRASQSSITSNSSLYECLQTSPSGTSLRSPEYYLSNEEQHSDNDSDDSSGSMLEAPSFNVFPSAIAKSVSPPGSSRKGSIISVGSAGGVSKKSSKRKSITGANIDAIQSSMLHRRNRSDVCTINLNLEPLQPDSLDARLSPPPLPQQTNQLPIEFNSNIFGLKGAAKMVVPAANENRVDFSIGPLDYNAISENLFETAHSKPNDASLLNVELLDQPALNLETLPETTTTNASNTPYGADNDLADLRGVPPMDDILDPATLLDSGLLTGNPAGISNLTPLSENNAKIRDLDQEPFFSPFPAGEDDLLFDSVLPAADPLAIAEAGGRAGGVIASNSVRAPTVYAASNRTNIDAFNF
ncbi:hypothetical protein HG536_0G01460 [Torulaspora globosa]|uniref:Uncharacterized protein n=1 Tax=Torulaspora globosa TaxID=48254 RepID=A0A7G3ZLA1_9SACH|nr:uncharacterized protein HG536_0G01460 [Torulaspora globosa]QLL34287.1 hypothetical protein HG536_0G01460 [Torulaspora globosa]